MFFTYLRRELAGRRKQTVIVAIGMALAIALVMIVNAISSGVSAAQADVLSSMYGVGTDVTVSMEPTPPAEGERPEGGPGRFDFGSEDGEQGEDSTQISRSRLTAGFGSTFDASTVETISAMDGVAAASGSLSLTNVSFSGEIPNFMQGGGPGGPMGEQGDPQTAPTGGADGAGGSSFDVESFTVLGLDPSATAVGPLSAVSLVDGRGLDADDVGQLVAVLDSAYATTNDLAVGDTLDVGGSEVEVVGTVESSSADAETAANVYLPLDVAQDLAGVEDVISDVYVQADSASSIGAVESAIETALPDLTVSTQADLAESVSGSLSTASGLITNLGRWLSIAVLVAAFLIAILFTVSGVTRRTRELGTLKAIGWSNRRIVRQVAGESVVQGLIGGAVGLVVGLVGIMIWNFVAPTVAATAATAATGGGPGGGGPFGGGGPGFGGPGGGTAATATSTTEVVLNAPLTIGVIAVAIALAVLGGLLAGAFGGWRASRLRPAEALRSIA